MIANRVVFDNRPKSIPLQSPSHPEKGTKLPPPTRPAPPMPTVKPPKLV